MDGSDLDELVLSVLDALEERGQRAVDEACAAHPTLADGLRARLAALADAGLLASPDEHPERLGDFRITRRLGGGGMGVVYAAVQEPIEREVALKVVRADQLYFPGARERFRREVQLVARLAHASIVPVYTVGEADGVPYFAMERLRGATLAEALAQLDHPPETGRQLADAVARVVEAQGAERPRVDGALWEGTGTTCVLRLGERVAEALAHAHARGVLHRDVKPSNLMLSVDGRALLFDFGLASATEVTRITRSGSRVGSLAYMSPEQARGDPVDERSDVYGLGALLCEALTLRPPHAGPTEAVTAALLRGDPPAPLRDRRLPRDVRTLLETALAHDPARRYQSAEALARDLANVLAHRPLEARPTGRAVRALRWVQRNPARAAALALAVTLPLALAAQQALANTKVRELLREQSAANAQIRVQSERAEANLERALEAVDVFVWQLGRDAFRNVPNSDGEFTRALESARDSLEDAIAQRPDDPHLSVRLLRVLSTLGQARFDAGDLQGAQDFYDRALAAGTGHADHPADLIPAHNGLALLAGARGRWEEAREHYERALASCEGVSGSGMLADVASLERNLSTALVALGELDAARVAADRAVAASERALDSAETDAERLDALVHLGGALSRRCWIQPGSETVRGASPVDDPAGRQAFERAVEVLDAVLEQRPERSDVRQELASVLVHAPWFLAPDAAQPLLARGLEHAAQLVAAHPDRLDILRTATELHGAMALGLNARGDHAGARPWFERASELALELLARGPSIVARKQLAARTLMNLSSVHIDLGQRERAAEPARRGSELMLELRASQGELSPTQDVTLAWCLVHEGYGRLARGEFERVDALIPNVPPGPLANDAVLVVAVAELHAGLADAAAGADADAAARHREAALELLERGVSQGFRMTSYLRAAPEWDGLRDAPRFAALLDALDRGDV